MERTLIKVTERDDGIAVTIEGTAPKLIAAMTSLIVRVAKSSGLPIEVICFTMMTAARVMEKENYGEATDTDKSIDDLFNDIIGRSDI